MISRILLAADDSPAALAAARLCVELAGRCGASVRTVTVHTATGPVPEAAADPVLSYVRRLADEAGVPSEGVVASGAVVPSILEHAQACGADLIVIGRSDSTGTGRPYMGHHTRHVLEFADRPVVVVPYGGRTERPASGVPTALPPVPGGSDNAGRGGTRTSE